MNIHRYGGTLLAEGAVALTGAVPTNDIAKGDPLFYLTTSDVTALAPASVFTWDTDLATTQAAFITKFAGMSDSRSRAATTDARDLRVSFNCDPTAVYEFELAAAANLEIGDYIGIAKAAGNALTNKVVAVATRSLAIGQVVEDLTSGTKIRAILVNALGHK
jgi:hypothetical protein